MATTQKDLTDIRFGRLVAIRNTGERALRKGGSKGGYIWECQCDCGNIVNVEISRLTSGVTKSCGCLHSDSVSKKMKKEDLTGKRFGNLTVIKWLEMSERNKDYRYYPYLCLCECGNYVQAKRDDLIKGNKVSCGCVHEKYSNSSKHTALKHGKSGTRIYGIWSMMCDRCRNPNNKNYCDYGGRGVVVCEEWLGKNGFQNFYNWAISNGYEEHLTIDRIDTNGNYEPQNCRWATMKVQGRNRRNNRKYDFNGENLTLMEISERTGIPIGKLSYMTSKNRM